MFEAADNADERTFEMLRRVKAGDLSVSPFSPLPGTASTDAGKRATILVVDDSASLRTLMVETLHRLGYPNIVEAEDGEAALSLIGSIEFDLIVLDINMPKLDGYGVLAALKGDPQRRHLPVVVASAAGEFDAVVRCIELGAEDFLPKPVHTVLLQARISAALERKQLRDLERLRLQEVQLAKELLEFEKEKAERLLLNIFPRTIAERLKRGEHTIAERFSSVTVLFADLVGFTGFANQTDPVTLVGLLNDLFTRFDHIAEKHGLEKIKTIGDSYLVVGGLPEPRADHAEAVASMGLEMLSAVTGLNADQRSDFSIRIGINSGPVVAGVIGRKKFTYDLWGTAVNLANRMQSSGLPNRIHLPVETFDLLGGKFRCTERGTIDCKGIGQIRTCLLDGKVEPGNPASRVGGTKPITACDTANEERVKFPG